MDRNRPNKISALILSWLRKILESLKNDKAPGQDNISLSVLKEDKN